MSRKLLFVGLLLGAGALLLTAGRAPTDRFTKSADGTPIHYVAAGAGEPALLFVHGWCCDASYWQLQMEHFASTHRVIAVDLAGHGQSGLDRGEWTMAAFAADVNAVLDQEKLNDVVLVGHSMGGAVIAEAALARPKRVRGLVGVDNFHDVTLHISNRQIEGLLGFLAADFPNNVKTWVGQMFPAGADSALADSIASDMASAPSEMGLGALDHLLHWYNEKPATVLPRLPAPLECINSDAGPTNTDTLKVLRPGYVLRLMPGGSHFLAQESPAVFNRLLEESLADFPPLQDRKP